MEDYVITVRIKVHVGWLPGLMLHENIELGMTCYRLIENISTGVSGQEYLQTLLDIKERKWG